MKADTRRVQRAYCRLRACRGGCGPRSWYCKLCAWSCAEDLLERGARLPKVKVAVAMTSLHAIKSMPADAERLASEAIAVHDALDSNVKVLLFYLGKATCTCDKPSVILGLTASCQACQARVVLAEVAP